MKLPSCLNLGLLCGLALVARAQEPPAAFSRTVSTGSQSVVVDFTRHTTRSENFEVLVQDAAGNFTTYEAGAARTYLGMVQGRPGALAAGWLKADGTLVTRISFEDGVEWSSTGGNASVRGSTNWTPAWPTSVVPAGGAGSDVKAAEVGVDATYREFVACGSNVDQTVAMAEFCLMASNAIYLRDAAILHRTGKIVVRTSPESDPYEPMGGDTGQLLPGQRTQWNSVIPVGTTHDLALVARPGAGGGLAYVGTVGTSSRYSANGTDGNGDFTVIWRHEAGHNWGSGHYEGGGQPEGPTIMSDNALSRFSSSELAKILAHRNSRSVLDSQGPYPFPLPPRANMDQGVFLTGSPVLLDVLANDSDSNGDAIVLDGFPPLSAAGGTLQRSVGSGPGGRDQILYNPPAGLFEGTDHFSYRIQDATGGTATGWVTVRPVAEGLLPVDHWALDETEGTTAASLRRGNRNGTHQNGASPGATGARPRVTQRGTYYDGDNDRTSVSSPGYNTATLTVTAWVRRQGAQMAWAPFFFTRAGSSAAGFGFGEGPELRYHWNDAGFDFAPEPALTVPDGEWCLAAMAVSPHGVTLHLRTAAGLSSATHTTPISPEAFNGTTYLARDGARYFRGWLDDVRVYPQTLTAAHIESLYQQADQPPLITVTSPLAGSSVSPLDVPLAATVDPGSWTAGEMEFLDGSSTLAVVPAAPYSAVIPAMEPGARTLVARLAFGDWGYRTDSDALLFTALPPPLPAISFGTVGLPSRSGPAPAEFVVRRSHPIGDLAVPLVISGTAVSGTDYEPLPESVTLPAGTLEAVLTLVPVAGPPAAMEKSVTLGAGSSAAFTVGDPASATLVIGDHITSVADGAWNVGETWSDGAAVAMTGTQGTGKDHAIAHVVSSGNPSANSQVFIARKLRVARGGVLDLARLHDGTNQNVSYSLPPLTLEDGASIRFRASNGSSTHTVPATVTTSGRVALRINGGNYSNAVNLTGRIAGTGTLEVISESNSGAVTGDLRQVSANQSDSPFAGNWTVNHTASGDDFAVLRAGASRSLGRGTITVGRRARLVSAVNGGLDSLSGVVLDGESALLQLTQPWNAPAATLTLAGGSPAPQVTLGNAASSIGTLRGSAGSITGAGSSSSLTIHQTADAEFGGSLSAPLTLVKQGPAELRLAGGVDPAVRLSVAAGRLVIDSATPAVSSLTVSGGELGIGAGAPLAVAGNVTLTGGALLLVLPAAPETGVSLPLVTYAGTLTGPPVVTVQGGIPEGLALQVDPGTGTNSQISATFVSADPYPAWIAGFDITGADAERTADPDGDGVPNLEEMLLGFDPGDPASRLRLTLVEREESSLRLRLNRAITAGSFVLQSADDLAGPWADSPLEVPTDADDFEFTTPWDGPRRFFRVVYTAP